MRVMKRMLFAVLLLAVVSARAEGFRFALMSDLHVTADSLAANDDQINATPGLSFVIVSGDFTDYGDDASLRKAKAILDGLKLKYYVTSGNHETKWSESGATAFGRIFGSDRFRFEYGNYLFLGFNTGPVIRMAEGHVAPQDVSWLEKELADYGTERPVFLVTHYPMMKGDVDNWYAVTDAVRKYDIRAFIGGHYHTTRLADYDGIPAFICRSTLRGGEPFGGYSEFEVTADSVIVYERKIGAGPQRWGAYSLKDTYFTADTADGDDLIALLHGAAHLLGLFFPLVLRTDQHEVENCDHQHQHDDGAAHTGRGGSSQNIHWENSFCVISCSLYH